jgi:hypothetical protein
MALPPHIPIAFKLLPHLVESAKAGRRTSYEELGKAVNIESRTFSRPLAFIRDFLCEQHNLPPLTVLVQKKGGDTASSSFDPAQFAALSSKDYDALTNQTVQRVYDYPRWDQALSGLQKTYEPI